MIQILHDNPHLTHSYYCSFDIKSLYTSCSMQLAKRTATEQFSREPSLLPAHFSITALDTLISFCLDYSYFEYHGNFYSQSKGGPMGSPLTVALAEVRVKHTESSALASSADPPSLYKHFVDDGISRYSDKQHAESFLAHLNSLSDDLVYTVEHPAIDSTLPFLDILLVVFKCVHYFHWLTMVAILQLKASKHFVYFVSIAVVTFTLLNSRSFHPRSVDPSDSISECSIVAIPFAT